MRKAFVLIAAIVLAALFASGCQSFHLKTVAGGEAAAVHADAATEKTDTTPAGDAGRIQKTVDTGNEKVSVTVDAAIQKPDSARFPVTEIRTRNFTQEEADRIISLLFGDRALYQPWEKTKSEYETEMFYLKEIIRDPLSTEEERGMAESNLEFLENQYQNAPETVEKEPAITLFSSADGWEECQKIDVWADDANNSRSALSIVNLENGANSHMLYVGDVVRNFQGYVPYETAVIKDRLNAGLMLQDAETMAKGLIRDIGLDLGLNASSLISYLPSGSGFDQLGDAQMQAYKFYFTRTVDGVPVTVDTRTRLGELGEEFGKAIYYEMASVTVDETGVSEFEYRAPYTVGDTLEENAKIIDGGEAEVKFEAYMKNRYAAVKPENAFQVKIHTIELGLRRIKNGDGGYALVPAWDFLGNIVYEQPNMTEETLSPMYSLAAINALDGTIIDKGYSFSTFLLDEKKG